MTAGILRVVLPNTELPENVIAWLQDNGAKNVTVVRSRTIDTTALPSIVTATLLGAASISTILIWFRRQIACTMIIDARNDQLNITYDCRNRRGRTVVICNGDTRIELVDPGYLVDLGKLAELAVTKGAEAVAEVARDAKIEFSVESHGEKNDA